MSQVLRTTSLCHLAEYHQGNSPDGSGGCLARVVPQFYGGAGSRLRRVLGQKLAAFEWLVAVALRGHTCVRASRETTDLNPDL